MSQTREHLLGYLLGALEPAELAAVERELEHDPQLRKDLAAIEAAMFPLGFPDRDDDASTAPLPVGLTSRTCDFIDDAKDDLVARPTPARIAAAVMSDLPASPSRQIRWADVIVVASVCLAAVSLIFPAIWTMRERQQIAACQQNLQYVGVSLADYAARCPRGCIPAMAVSGNRSFAGVYGASLLDRELLESSQWLVCPGSELAAQRESFRVPRLIEIDRATGETVVRLQRMSGGDYGYNMGYFDNGVYKTPKHESRTHYVLMSDAPATFLPQRKTKNHGGRGQNLLYEDGHVRWVVNVCDDLCDDPFLNRSGLVAAGQDCDDVVLGESLAKPMAAMFRLTP
jgi:hypothetical protein